MKAAINIPGQLPRVDDDRLRSDPAAPGFAKEMSHELHTPLNVIIGLCQTLERDRQATLSATQRDSVERMERSARALLQTVDHLLGCLRSGHFE